MSVTIGSFVLTENDYAPVVNISFEYFKTDSGEIIGGHTIATITGNVSVSDQSGSQTGSIVMNRLKSIRNLGKKTECVNVSIPNFRPFGGKAKVTNVSIDQGSDPSWVNQGAYTIEVTGLIQNIPPNSFNITASDGVKELSRTESIEIGEDSHGYIYDAANGISKAFVTFSNSISLRCEPFCNNSVDAIKLLEKIVKIGPTKNIFNQYKTWNSYLQSRSLNINTDGSVSFNCSMILTPPLVTTPALVDLDFSYDRNYESENITYKTIGTINGLVSVPWSQIVNIQDSCSVSKFANAQSVFNTIKSKYSKLESWSGQTLTLEEKPNCPAATQTTIGQCRIAEDDDNDSDFISPTSTTVSSSTTDGTISFTFEWSTNKDENGNTCVNNGARREVTVDITERQPNYVEHILPGRGTLIQNLRCNSAKRLSITVSVTYPEDVCGSASLCEVNDGLQIAYEQYLNDGTFWLKTGDKRTTTINSSAIKQDFIECR